MYLFCCDTVPSDWLLSCCSDSRCRCYNCDNCCICYDCYDCFDCDTVPSVLLLYLVCCFDCNTVPWINLFNLFYCFILMIIVKKIQNPNIFFTFSKKYYCCHIYHIISADLPGFWQKHINLYQKTVFFDQRISEKYHFYPYFCIFFVLKCRFCRFCRITFNFCSKI